MFTKCLKTTVFAVVVIFLVLGLFFGKDAVSYITSTAKSFRTAAKNSVPIEFELMRARDLLEQIIPEMHANIRLIAQEEVEVAALKSDIAGSTEAIEQEKQRIARIRDTLDVHQAVYYFSGREYSRAAIERELAGRFERFKESELILAGKQRLLSNREESLASAMELLEKTRGQKELLEDKIESLASQHRLIQAAAIGSKIQVDNSKLGQTEKLIAQIQKRLDVAERVLAHESKFVQEIPLDTIVEEDLLQQVDDYFESRQTPSMVANAREIAAQ